MRWFKPTLFIVRSPKGDEQKQDPECPNAESFNRSKLTCTNIFNSDEDLATVALEAQREVNGEPEHPPRLRVLRAGHRHDADFVRRFSTAVDVKYNLQRFKR